MSVHPNVRVKVLIADDTAGHRRTLAAIVEGLGWTARCVDSGERAVKACAAEQFDVILTDFHMPDANGLEVTRRIRAMGGWAKAAPIVLVTSANSAEMDRRARLAGADGCLGKPARPAQIANVLLQALAARAVA